MPSIEVICKGVGLSIALLFLFFGWDSAALHYSVFAVILLTVGIPHGAIDHLTSSSYQRRGFMLRFILSYLLLIGVYLVLWAVLPVVALLAFLLMSAYHFGQTHFLGRSTSSSLANTVNYLLRGGFFLAVILFGDFQMTREILSPLLSVDFLLPYRFHIITSLLLLSVFNQYLLKISWGVQDFIDLIILAPLLYFCPLLISFILYFGFWHALPSILIEYRYLRESNTCQNLRQFVVQLLPFTLLSLAGIGVVLVLGLRFLSREELFLLFFVLISLISFPHIIYMNDFIKRLSSTDQS
ncbi:Brp/Blh family beta-carotene 15,15'-dioxygenase [Algoriphagus namhaensis]